MTENEFMLADRIQKIKSVKDLEEKAFIAFSGGKDSTVLHYLIDEALPGNKIPRVYVNTGIEYKAILEYVKKTAMHDDRIIIYNAGVNIKRMLEEKGYPFKSKIFARMVAVYQRSGYLKGVKKFLGKIEGNGARFRCPNSLKYVFSDKFKIKVSDKCCNELKKKTALKWQRENKRTIAITGMRRAEGGARMKLSCLTYKGDEIEHFNPLAPLNDDFIQWYAKERNITFCELYYPPYNFVRTGCKGCPFALNLKNELEVMKKLLPAEYKQCEYIWGPVYEEYRRIGYRIKKYNQLELF